MEPRLRDTLYSTNYMLSERVRTLEKQNRLDAAQEAPNDAWPHKVSVSCPPDTYIHIRCGAWIWYTPDWGTAQYVESASLDMSDPGVSVHNDYVFTNAYWYLPVGLTWVFGGRVDASGDPPSYPLYMYGMGPGLQVWGGGLEEFETAGEAQASWDNADYSDVMSYNGTALCVLVLRNNGNVVDSAQYQPIDAVNRGRSFLYRDVRKYYRV